MSLVRAELRRLFKRRFTRYTLVLLVLAFIAIAGGVLADQPARSAPSRAGRRPGARPPGRRRSPGSSPSRSAAECEAARERRGQRPHGSRRSSTAREITGPPPGTFEAEWFLPYQFNFREEFGIFIAVFAGILALFAFIVGASYVGAEWSSGGMMNLLLWRPKRLTVLFTKLGVLLGSVLAIGGRARRPVDGRVLADRPVRRSAGQADRRAPGSRSRLDGARGLGLVLAVAAVGFRARLDRPAHRDGAGRGGRGRAWSARSASGS